MSTSNNNDICYSNDYGMSECNQQLIIDAYHGTGGFVDGCYLSKIGNEKNERFNQRKEGASYENFVKQIIDGSNSEAFEGVSRVSNNEKLKGFIDDADGNGTTLDEVIRSAGLNADLYGSVLMWLDSSGDQPLSEAEKIEGRDYPYLVTLNRDKINNYVLSGKNNVYSFDYCESIISQDGEDLYINVYYKNGFFWREYVQGASKKVTKKTPALSKIFVLTFEEYIYNTILPWSKWLPLAQTAKTVYQLGTLTYYQAESTTFNILVMEKVLEESGSTPALNLDENSVIGTEAKFISPEDTMQKIRAEIESKKNSAFISNNMAILATSADSSGEAKEQSDKIRQEELKKKSQKMASIDRKLALAFMIAESIPQQDNTYIASYPENFSLDSTTKFINDMDKILSQPQLSPENADFIINQMMLKSFPTATQEQKEEFNNSQTRNTGLSGF